MTTDSPEWANRALDLISLAATGPVTVALHTGPPKVISPAPPPLEPLLYPATIDGPAYAIARQLTRDLDWMVAMVLRRKAEMGCLCKLDGADWDTDWRTVTVKFRNDRNCSVHRGLDEPAATEKVHN